MPGRISRSSVSQQSAGPAPGKKSRKRKAQRSQNAFAIASATEPDRVKIKQHRFGEADLDADEPRSKRRRMSDGDEDEDEGYDAQGGNASRVQRKSGAKGGFDEASVSSGSDGEGNRWRVGVGKDEDSDEVDSDEAFGDSDIERFEDYTFRGSKSGTSKPRRTKVQTRKAGALDLDEEEDAAGSDDEDSDDSLGSDAVDLATMLDDDQDSELEEDAPPRPEDGTSAPKSKFKGPKTRNAVHDDFGGFSDDNNSLDGARLEQGEEDSDIDDASESISSEGSDGQDEFDRLEQLQDIVTSLSTANQDLEDHAVDDAEIKPGALLAALNQTNDPSLRLGGKTSTRDGSGKQKPLHAPLPKRQQDSINRKVAYDKAKDTLNRWIDTVKHNRRAEHLSFPLRDAQAQEAQGTHRLLPASTAKPRNELESAIEGILQQSGLSKSKPTHQGVDDYEVEQQGDDLPPNKPSVEQTLARRAELRRARDLLFREEQRSKRIKKIKSKAYRRVHRREREKNAQKERDMMVAAGMELSDDERENNDRRRAEERMGARHRESKWAKGVKQTGRAAWDDGARAGVEDMARRNEELRARVQGKTPRRGLDDGINRDGSASDSDSDDDDDQDEFKLRSQLDQADEAPTGGNKSSLASLKFMQKADARQKQLNDDAVRTLRREMDGHDGNSEDSETEVNPGRRTYGPRLDDLQEQPKKSNRQELEEGSESSDEEGEPDQSAERSSPRQASPAPNVGVVGSGKKLHRPNKTPLKMAGTSSSTSIRVEPSGEKSLRQEKQQSSVADNTEGWTTIELPASRKDDRSSAKTTVISPSGDIGNLATTSDGEENEADISLRPTQESLVRAAFGVDDAEEESFAREKAQAAQDEDDKVVDNTLPGWGSWAGQGIKKRPSKRANAQAPQRKRFMQKVEDGVKPENRRDKKLQDVILSEKRVKKNAKYLAPTLPHPFESRAQYERSLRLPIGPEWTTKESFQGATKPRVMVRGGIIKAMEKPLL